MFQVVIGLEPVGKPHETFEEAFREFFSEIEKLLAEGTSFQTLETACYIEHVSEQTAMGFYDCRDLAYRIGLMYGEGKLADKPAIKLSEEEVWNIFLTKTIVE